MSRMCAFIQARMSSRRFPGKVLAPLQGHPVIWHVIQSMRAGGFADGDIVLLTSSDPTDDPIAAYAEKLGTQVFRGSLHNVLERVVQAGRQFPCEWILRATADSPFYSPELVSFMRQAAKKVPAEFLTTTHHRTLPIGMNLEAFRHEALCLLMERAELSAEDKEHVTRAFHRGTAGITTCSVELAGADFSGSSVSIDYPDDLADLENGTYAPILSAIPWNKLIIRPVTT
jgi:spore coat polysaccharide biosynthesis protein SpsF